jgi:hypothetical protein
VFGAEGVSKVTADPKKASAGDYLSAGIEVVSVIPVGKIAKAGKGLIVAKEVAKEGAEKVVKEGAEKVVKEGAEKVVKEGAEKLTKEGTEKVVKESTEKVTKEAAPVLAKEAAEQALKKELSQFTRAAEFGIQEYGALQKALKGTGLHAHHLIEQRFAKILKVSRSKMKAIALTPAEHQIFTNRWREAIGYIGSKNPLTTATAKPEHIRAMARKIYEDYPQILKQLGL